MSTITPQQTLSYANAAGFQGVGKYIIAAIAQAESGLNTLAKNCNNPGGTCDRGILQINNYWHPEVTDQQAYDPTQAFQAAFRISNGGKDFTPWTTFTSGAYKQYVLSSTITPGGGVGDTLTSNNTTNNQQNSSSSTPSGNCAPWDITCVVQNVLLNIAHSDTVERGILLFFGITIILIGLMSLSNTKKE